MPFWRRDASFGDAWITFSVVCVGFALFVALTAPRAAADTASVIAPSNPHEPTVESGWQAGTCNAEPPAVATECSVSTPGQYFETAAAHPNFGFTQFIVAHTAGVLGPLPTNELAFVRVELPVGLSVNPGATERCPIATFEAGASGCPAGSVVGESAVTAATPFVGLPVPPVPGVTAVTVYNVVPKEGQAARFGLELAGNEVFLEGDIASSGDYHEGSRSPFRTPCRSKASKVSSSRTAWSSTAARATAPS